MTNAVQYQMNRRDNDMEIWTEAVEEQLPNWSLTTSLGAITTMAGMTCLIWLSILFIATDLTLVGLLEGNSSVTLLFGLVEFSYFIFSMAIAVCLTKYIWYVYRVPNKIASDVNILTPSIIVIFIGGVILVFLSILDSTLNTDVESIVSLYYVASFGLLGLLGSYVSSARYVVNKELPKDLNEYKQDMKNPTKGDIVLLSDDINFKAITSTIVISGVLLYLSYSIIDNRSLVGILVGNVPIDSVFDVTGLVYFVISVTIGMAVSIVLWYIYSLPDEVSSEIQLIKVFVTAGIIGVLLIVFAVVGSTFLTVSDRFLEAYYILSYILMLFVTIAMSSTNFHEESVGDKLEDYKSNLYSAKTEHKNLIQEYERLQSQAPDTITIGLTIDDSGILRERDVNKIQNENAQIRDSIEEFKNKLRKYTGITDELNQVKSKLNSTRSLLSGSEFVTAMNNIAEVEPRLTELNERASEHNFTELVGDVDEIQQQCDNLRSEVEENARTYVENEIASIESKLASIEDQIEEDNNTPADEALNDVGTRLDDTQKITSRLDLEDLHDELESLLRRRDALVADIGADMDIEKAFSTLDSKFDRAESAIDQENFDQAANLLSESETQLNSIEQSFADSVEDQDQPSTNFDELVKQYQQQYNKLRSTLADKKRESLETEKTSIQADLETVKESLSNENHTDASDLLSDVEERLNAAHETATQNEFSDLHGDIESLFDNYEQLREATVTIERYENIKNTISSQLDEATSLIKNQQLAHAYECLTTCRSRLRELEDEIKKLDEGPEKSSLEVSEFLNQQLENHYTALAQREREYVETEIRSLQSVFNTVEEQLQQGKIEQAKENISEISTGDTSVREQTATPDPEHSLDQPSEQFESRFERARTVAVHAELADLQEQINSLEARHAELIEQIDQSEKLSNDIESFHDKLDNIQQIIEDEKYDSAKRELAKFEDQLNELDTTVIADQMTIFQNGVATLRQRQGDFLNEVEIEQQRHEVREDLSSFRSRLEEIQSMLNSDSIERARTSLTDLEPKIESLEIAVTEFDDLEEEFSSLQNRHEELLEEVTRLEEQTVPETVSRVPDISIDYEDLYNEEHIGSGGKADVSKATYQTSNSNITVAIKKPRGSGTLHTADVERMLNEAETWNKLDDHDHIVGVIDYGSEPLPWIAMEYMDGGHLGEYTDMDLDQKIWTAYAVTEGVLHAHRRGVAHLDLKPKNILFRTVDNGWDVPKVSDWGLSKHLLEHSNSVEGLTVEYAAPEQFDDEYGSTDDFTDIYQLGAVFYELFTGLPVYEGQPFTVMNQIKNETPRPPSEVSDVPEKIDDILMKSLAKDKADRYSHIVYLRDALKELVDEF